MAWARCTVRARGMARVAWRGAWRGASPKLHETVRTLLRVRVDCPGRGRETSGRDTHWMAKRLAMGRWLEWARGSGRSEERSEAAALTQRNTELQLLGLRIEREQPTRVVARGRRAIAVRARMHLPHARHATKASGAWSSLERRTRCRVGTMLPFALRLFGIVWPTSKSYRGTSRDRGTLRVGGSIP